MGVREAGMASERNIYIAFEIYIAFAPALLKADWYLSLREWQSRRWHGDALTIRGSTKFAASRRTANRGLAN